MPVADPKAGLTGVARTGWCAPRPSRSWLRHSDHDRRGERLAGNGVIERERLHPKLEHRRRSHLQSRRFLAVPRSRRHHGCRSRPDRVVGAARCALGITDGRLQATGSSPGRVSLWSVLGRGRSRCGVAAERRLPTSRPQRQARSLPPALLPTGGLCRTLDGRLGRSSPILPPWICSISFATRQSATTVIRRDTVRNPRSSRQGSERLASR